MEHQDNGNRMNEDVHDSRQRQDTDDRGHRDDDPAGHSSTNGNTFRVTDRSGTDSAQRSTVDGNEPLGSDTGH